MRAVLTPGTATTKGTLRGLIHRGGLRADVLSDGDITPGALIETVN